MTTLASEIGFSADQLQAVTSQAFDLVESGDLDGAVAVFTGLVALNPDDAGIQAALGSVFHQQGKVVDAMTSYDAAIKLDGNAVLARVNRGELRCKQGDRGGVDDLKIAAGIPSAVQARAKSLLKLYAR
jgi:Flp pilus assembly protein TadD